ncbi:MAG: family 16 glycoside hydrolase [Chthoniobacteraceae bacterium]
MGDTPHQQVGTYKPHPEKGPLKLQDHNNPMRFRNIWVRELKPREAK